MTLTDYESTILQSSLYDWKHIQCYGAQDGPSYHNQFTYFGTYNGSNNVLLCEPHDDYALLTTDLSFTVAWGIVAFDNSNDPWMKNFADPTGDVQIMDFFYAGQLVHRDFIVSVDGGRCILPHPKLDSSTSSYFVSDKFDRFLRVLAELTNHQDYDRYFEQGGLQTRTIPWMK